MRISQIVTVAAVVAITVFAYVAQRRSDAHRKAGRISDASRVTQWMILGSLWSLCGVLAFATLTSKAGIHGVGGYRLAIVIGITLLLTFRLPSFFRRLEEARKEQERQQNDSQRKL